VCNRYSNQIAYREYVEAFMKTPMPLVYPKPEHAPNLEPNEDIRPTDKAPILRPVDGGLELKTIRWGLIPPYHHGAIKEFKLLTTNAQIEGVTKTRTFKDSFEKRRCLVPVDKFYEWTGEKGHKIKWAFTKSDEDWFCFAGIWSKAKTADGEIESFALLTAEAGPDISSYHKRQPVVLDRDMYSTWLNNDTPFLKVSDYSSAKINIQKVD